MGRGILSSSLQPRQEVRRRGDAEAVPVGRLAGPRDLALAFRAALGGQQDPAPVAGEELAKGQDAPLRERLGPGLRPQRQSLLQSRPGQQHAVRGGPEPALLSPPSARRRRAVGHGLRRCDLAERPDDRRADRQGRLVRKLDQRWHQRYRPPLRRRGAAPPPLFDGDEPRRGPRHHAACRRGTVFTTSHVSSRPHPPPRGLSAWSGVS